ncbi:tetratricopeptide repeat-containing sulfotransferase family protein [Aliikangiella coralliicola]|uniref:Tetratricopeptide repeat protein n=1 Tax=Aliikangiella coralliicola TaxID=2592383 RepID=A0A545U7M7_9GAMM|nr:tetratricopeptide repeat-containing sulfotransferase family protein [Aliikangiella coralliicola]TQV85468.1 tetratricopeptide repeat protein [Aliikangiella coralliicola]
MQYSEFIEQLDQAKRLANQGQYDAAESIYIRLLELKEHQEQVLQLQVELFLNSNQNQKAIQCLSALVKLKPAELFYCDSLANVLLRFNRIDDAINCYKNYLKCNPDNADTYFNLAIILKQKGELYEAVNAYQQALKNNISQPEEVYNNIGVIYSEMRKKQEAKDCFETALKTNGNYLSAKFNLAGLLEEQGHKENAVALYEEVLKQDPGYLNALVRMSNALRISRADDPIIKKLKRASRKINVDPLTQEGLMFSLGKVHDDCGQYDDAIHYYHRANELSRKRVPQYKHQNHEVYLSDLMKTFSSDWFVSRNSAENGKVVFICGMFRSGSTLAEQILAGHSKITAGGELSYFPELTENRLSPFPSSVEKISENDLATLAQEYREHCNARFPDAELLTDKRPDNFQYLGLIKKLFPEAKIIHTVRNKLDNCLSIYFQQLSEQFRYANSLSDINHYYTQYQRLMDHWKTFFHHDIYDLNYEELVSKPEETVRSLLDFCGLEWESGCLDFHQRNNQVKTASLWQVREPLYTRSSERWRHYEKHLESITP